MQPHAAFQRHRNEGTVRNYRGPGARRVDNSSRGELGSLDALITGTRRQLASISQRLQDAYENCWTFVIAKVEVVLVKLQRSARRWALSCRLRRTEPCHDASSANVSPASGAGL